MPFYGAGAVASYGIQPAYGLSNLYAPYSGGAAYPGASGLPSTGTYVSNQYVPGYGSYSPYWRYTTP